MITTVMMVAYLGRIGECAVEICRKNIIDIAMTSTHGADTVCCELVECAHAHIAGKHNGYAHVLHYGSDVRLASAALW